MRDMVCSVLYPASLAVSCASAACSESALHHPWWPRRLISPRARGWWPSLLPYQIPPKLHPKTALSQKVRAVASAPASKSGAPRVCRILRQCHLENTMDRPEHGASASSRRGGDDKAEIPAVQPVWVRQARGGEDQQEA